MCLWCCRTRTARCAPPQRQLLPRRRLRDRRHCFAGVVLCAYRTSQVNAAVDEAAALGEATAKLMATVRRDSRAVPIVERKRAQTLLHSVVVGCQPRPVMRPSRHTHQ